MTARTFLRQVVAELADPYGLRRAAAEHVRAVERERIARSWTGPRR